MASGALCDPSYTLFTRGVRGIGILRTSRVGGFSEIGLNLPEDRYIWMRRTKAPVGTTNAPLSSMHATSSSSFGIRHHIWGGDTAPLPNG
jgi:hypothetical protein